MVSDTTCPRCNGEGYLTLWGTPRVDVACGECSGHGKVAAPFLSLGEAGHECEEAPIACTCIGAVCGPDPTCNLHGDGNPWPPRCWTCGRFLPWNVPTTPAPRPGREGRSDGE